MYFLTLPIQGPTFLKDVLHRQYTQGESSVFQRLCELTCNYKFVLFKLTVMPLRHGGVDV